MKRTLWLSLILLVITALAPGSLIAQSKALYLSDRYGIHRIHVQTEELESIIPITLRNPGTLTIETSAQKMYWTDFDELTSTGTIYSANMDGSDVAPLLFEGLDRPQGITIEAVSGKIYWTDTQTGTISRANLDGTMVEPLITDGLRSPQNIVIDTLTASMLWTDMAAGSVQRANLDGSEIEGLVVSSLAAPNYIALDPVARKVYWTDDNASAIRRANLDGSEIENLISSTNIPSGLSLDLVAGVMYWTEMPGFGGPRKIRRATLDGADEEDVIALNRGFFPQSIAVDPASEEMYWFDNFNKRIQRAPYNGFTVEDIHIATRLPYGIAIDDIEGKVYWTDSFTRSILRANLNGTNIEYVHEGISQVWGIAVDAQNMMVYWSDEITLRRSTYSGANIEILTTGLGFLDMFDLEPESGSIYWGDQAFGAVQKLSLSDKSIEDIIPDISVNDVVAFPDEDVLYLIRDGNILRFDQSDSSIVDLHQLPPNRGGTRIDLDEESGKLYWIEYNFQGPLSDLKLMTASLDGSDVEELNDFGLLFPNDIVVGPVYVSRSSNEDEHASDFSNELSVSTYPNPFINFTTIAYTLTERSEVRLQIFDLLGREVSILFEGSKQAGEHRETWDALNVPTGVYLVRLTTNDGLRATKSVVKVE